MWESLTVHDRSGVGGLEYKVPEALNNRWRYDLYRQYAFQVTEALCSRFHKLLPGGTAGLLSIIQFSTTVKIQVLRIAGCRTVQPLKLGAVEALNRVGESYILIEDEVEKK